MTEENVEATAPEEFSEADAASEGDIEADSVEENEDITDYAVEERTDDVNAPVMPS